MGVSSVEVIAQSLLLKQIFCHGQKGGNISVQRLAFSQESEAQRDLRTRFKHFSLREMKNSRCRSSEDILKNLPLLATQLICNSAEDGCFISLWYLPRPTVLEYSRLRLG